MNTARRSRSQIVLVPLIVIDLAFYSRNGIEDEDEDEDEEFARLAQILRESGTDKH